MSSSDVRHALEKLAVQHNLSGTTNVIIYREYEEENFHSSAGVKEEVFENSDLSYFITKVIEHLPIRQNQEIHSIYTSQFPIADFPEKYLWEVSNEVFTLDEINEKFSNNPAYDVDLKNVEDLCDPLYDGSVLNEIINDNVYNLHNTIEWDMEKIDYSKSIVVVTAVLELTLDQIMDLPDYSLTGWTYEIKTRGETFTITG